MLNDLGLTFTEKKFRRFAAILGLKNSKKIRHFAAKILFWGNFTKRGLKTLVFTLSPSSWPSDSPHPVPVHRE